MRQAKEAGVRKHKKHTKMNLKTDVRQQKKIDSTVKIFDVRITGTLKREVLKRIGLQRKEMLHVATVNAEFVMEARNNPRFAQVLTQCYTIADSWGVVWAANSPIERISGVELVEEILIRANEKREKVFLLGASSGVAEAAASRMALLYPNAVYGWFEGAKTVAVEANEEASMTIAKINGFEPDYLLVAYGSPWQDIWIEDNRPYLRARVAVGVGGVLDEWAGRVAICPKWVDEMGLKWLFRLVHEPWRVPRIARVIQFALIVILTRQKALLRQGFGG